MTIRKDLAKYTAQQLIVTQLTYQCDARDTLHQFDEDDEFLLEVNKQVEIIIESLQKRSDKLNLKYQGMLPNYVAESQHPDNILKEEIYG
tara:strand:- start:1913 stop:2182 length:270 start_codon:yes stop_codon:yes gene_type:complete